jgi:hypothetical protein
VSKQHSFIVSENRCNQFAGVKDELARVLNSRNGIVLNSGNEKESDNDSNNVSESNHCVRLGFAQGLPGDFQIYDANRRAAKLSAADTVLRHDLPASHNGSEKGAMQAFKAAGERNERPQRMPPFLSNSNETNCDQHSNLSNHCALSNSDQGVSCNVEDSIRDAATSKIRALQIYDSNRRTVEFAIQASGEREERLKKLIKAGSGLCFGSKPKRPGFVADASYNSTHAPVAHSAFDVNSHTMLSNIEANPILEYGPLTCPNCGNKASPSARYCRCCSTKLT